MKERSVERVGLGVGREVVGEDSAGMIGDLVEDDQVERRLGHEMRGDRMGRIADHHRLESGIGEAGVTDIGVES